MTIDDALSWAEENVLEFVFDFYVKMLLEKMWSMPECQKGVRCYDRCLMYRILKLICIYIHTYIHSFVDAQLFRPIEVQVEEEADCDDGNEYYEERKWKWTGMAKGLCQASG